MMNKRCEEIQSSESKKKNNVSNNRYIRSSVTEKNNSYSQTVLVLDN